MDGNDVIILLSNHNVLKLLSFPKVDGNVLNLLLDNLNKPKNNL